ncbi:hypothetical protein APHAL10511_005489 [Amanita phalloides]|nr:hypothetical protein APHAL10511_005489 [Amanita phalloides]
MAYAHDTADLLHVSLLYPAIDNHAHPLLSSRNRDDLPLEGAISEARGEALINDAPHTLACFRAQAQLTRLLGLPMKSSWEDVKAQRAKTDYNELCRQCFQEANIHCMLLDDGLDQSQRVEGIAWHNQFATYGARRIVRIEVEAEALLQDLFKPYLANNSLSEADLKTLFDRFTQKFQTHLRDAISSTENKVVALKSIVCYRTGLNVSLDNAQEAIKISLNDLFSTYRQTQSCRLQSKSLNDYVVCLTLDICRETEKPIQFHTGLGDDDITLSLASPALLQPLIKAYPEVKFILLHASYPFTREASYLTAVFSNVFLDFGEVFPMVSGQGQRDILNQVLELSPTTKIMFSTDGRYWPESYYLASIQARNILYEVFRDALNHGELTEAQAIEITKAVLFKNANRIYALGLPVPAPQVQGSPHWQVTGSHGTPNVNAPLGQFEWSPSFAGGRIMPPVPVPQAQGSHTPNVHAAPLGAGTSSPPQGPHVTNSASQTVDANRPPSEPAHDHRQVAHKNPAHVTNPGQTVDANRPASEPALPDYKLPPTKADKFVDLTKVHIDIRLPKSACVLPPKSWYRVRSSMEPKYFSTVSPVWPTAIRQYSIAVPAELGLLVLIPPHSIVEISKFPSDIRVPADSGIRVIDVPDSDKKMIWEKCLESYKEQFNAIRREFPNKKKFHARIRFMQKCFDSNLWEFGREQEPDGSVKFNFVFLELKPYD